MHKSISDHPKIFHRIHVPDIFQVWCTHTPPGSFQRCSPAAKSGPNSYLLHPWKSEEIFLKMLFLKQFWQHIRSPQGSMVDFGPRNALNEKCPATFLVRNVMENTFRTYLRHLESIWSGPKCYISANKYAILLVHLTSFYDFYEFPMHKSISDHPKINHRMHVQDLFKCNAPIHPPGSLQRCSTAPESGPKSHLLHTWES